jgi:hypothetical protein
LLVEHDRLGNVEPDLRHGARLESRELEGNRVRRRWQPGRQVSAGAIGNHRCWRGAAIGYRHRDTRQGAARAVGDDAHQTPAIGLLLLSRNDDGREHGPREDDRCE